MNPMWIFAALSALLLIGLVAWVLLQYGPNQKKNQLLESQLNELRRDLLGLSTAHTQSATKMETIADTVAVRLEGVSKALQEGARDSSTITSQAQTAMATELKNTREQIGQMQKQLSEVTAAGQQMQQATQTIESILGGTKSRGSFGEVTLERLLEDCLAKSQYEIQHRFRSGEAVDAVVHLRDKKKMAIDSKFPLEAYRRLISDGEEARKSFVSAVKTHADSIAKKYIVPGEGTLDYALMFVPSEAVYYEMLMSQDSKGMAIDSYCRSKNILAVSPNSLFAYLCVISVGLRGMQIEENARHLSDNLASMGKQLEDFSECFGKVGTQLRLAQQNYAEADKRFDKVSNTMETLLTATDALPLSSEKSSEKEIAERVSGSDAFPGIVPTLGDALREDPQGTLLMPPAASKKSA
jgi:DNA recombination protein RmuC